MSLLPALIEFLSSVEEPGFGRLCRPGKAYLDLVMTPTQQLTFNMIPPFNAFAAIKFSVSYDWAPGAVYSEVTQGGDKYIAGTNWGDQFRELLPYYILFTQSHPLQVLFRNNTALNQHLYGTQWNLIIDTVDRLQEVQKLIGIYSAKYTTDLIAETNSLLRQVRDELEQPVPAPVSPG